MGALTRTIHAIIEVKFMELELKKGQAIYLTRICEHPGINSKELCQMLMVDKTTASKVIKKLIDVGFIYKEADPKDKRAMKLYPTEKAEGAYKIIITEENRLTSQCYYNLNEEEQALALNLIKSMAENIQEDWYTLKKYKV